MTIKFEPSNRVQWFSGDHFEEGAESVGRVKALAVILNTLKQSPNRDMRQDELTLAAVAYLRGILSDKPWLADNFMKALSADNPEQRFNEARIAYENLAKGLRCDFA